MIKTAVFFLALALAGVLASATEFHVAKNGDDANPGTLDRPFRTIQRAADAAQAGDVVTVHAGVYRERVAPPRGGTSDQQRIVYQAASGEEVTITGSEPVTGWEKVAGDTWEVTLPNSFFGPFNPFAAPLHGDWCHNPGGYHPGAVFLNGDWLLETTNRRAVLQPVGHTPLWYCEVSADHTTLIAQFAGMNPNAAAVEVTVRPTVFTPEKPGINYLTVRGFHLCNAAPAWAPPTAEQIGLISALWCRGWIIEDNDIGYSPCCGVALGKYGDAWDNRAGTATGYVGTLTRALTNGWNRATVGSHVVRRNRIHDCEQTGIVGSLGCAFSTVTDNDIHDIHVRQLYGGAEMAGIKFHGAIDVVIRRNHIYRCGDVAGIWLDWMCQGVQITENLLHDNTGNGGDLFLEMQHGPILLANNLFLSPRRSFNLNSQGIAFAHNLFAGPLHSMRGDRRVTPYQQPHDTALAGMHADNPQNDSGDHRFFNNLFIGSASLSALDSTALPCQAGGNVYLQGACPATFEAAPLVLPDFAAGLKLEPRTDGWYLTLNGDAAWRTAASVKPVTTATLGRAVIPGCAYENGDGSPFQLLTDYFGQNREAAHPFPGPFESLRTGTNTFKVWPVR